MCHSQGELDLSNDDQLKSIKVIENNDDISNEYMTLFNFDLHGNSVVITSIVIVCTLITLTFLYKIYKCCKVKQQNKTLTLRQTDSNNNSSRDKWETEDSNGGQGTTSSDIPKTGH